MKNLVTASDDGGNGRSWASVRESKRRFETNKKRQPKSNRFQEAANSYLGWKSVKLEVIYESRKDIYTKKRNWNNKSLKTFIARNGS